MTAKWLLVAGIFLQLAATTTAHTPDTSYAIVKFTPDELQVELRYDLESLSRIVAIDSNHDGFIDRGELQLASPQLRKFLRREIQFEINEHVTDLGEYEPARWPPGETRIAQIDWNQSIVAFPFVRKVREIPESVSLSFSVFDRFGDRHKVLGVFEQPGKPPYELIYDAFEPDFLYFTDYSPSWWSQLGTFVWLGVEHIFIGYDHILFLLGLMIAGKFWALVKIVSAFTVAHTATLILAATGVIALPSRLVEVCIAATIVYVASENLLRTSIPERWRLTFAFGLIHGFGFANVLRDLGLPSQGMTRCLLAFNVGVEIGQLTIIAALWPLWHWVQKTKYASRAAFLLSSLILALGSGWLIDRLFGLEIMPF